MLKLGTTGVSTTYKKAYLGNILVYDGYAGIKTTPNSNNYVLNNSAEGKNKGNIKIGYGQELKQEITEGRNLFNEANVYNGYTQGNVGDTIYYGSSTSSKTYKNCYNVTSGQTYTISWKPNTVKSVAGRNFMIIDNSNVILQKISYTNSNNLSYVTFTANYSGKLDVTLDYNATEKQLELGSTATDYEPYTGGYASPSPNWAQDITIVKGQCKITSSEKNSKNLFDLNSPWTFNKSIGIGNSAGKFPFAEGDNRFSFFFECEPNTTYTLSMKTTGSSLYIWEHYSLVDLLQYTPNNQLKLNNNLVSIASGGTIPNTQTFTTSENAKIVGIYTGMVTIPTEIQIEKGSNASSYVLHKSEKFDVTLPDGMFLGSMGTASNYIYGTKNNWKLKHGIIKVKLKDMTFRYYAVTQGSLFRGSLIENYNYVETQTVKCKMYMGISGSYSDISNRKNNDIYYNNGVRMFDIIDNRYSDVETFSSMIQSSTNDDLYFSVTPTDIDITDTTLIAQLNNIADNLQTYKGGTIVFTTSENLEPNIQFDYRAI